MSSGIPNSVTRARTIALRILSLGPRCAGSSAYHPGAGSLTIGRTGARTKADVVPVEPMLQDHTPSMLARTHEGLPSDRLTSLVTSLSYKVQGVH